MPERLLPIALGIAKRIRTTNENENPAIQKLSPSTNPNICLASAPVKNNIVVPSLRVLLPLSTGSDSGRNVGANMCAIRRLSSSYQACRRSCSVRVLLSRS